MCQCNLVASYNVEKVKLDAICIINLKYYSEVCELVELFLLSLKTGLYRDHGLAVRFLSVRNTENLKKDIDKLFKQNGQKVNINLDMIYRDNLIVKRNNVPQYVLNSNHPPNIIDD